MTDPNLDEGARPRLGVLVFYCPVDDTDRVLDTVFAAGAGALGDYRECAWRVTGTGQFHPLPGADPTIGSVGTLEHVVEDRVECVVPLELVDDVLSALRAAHPYEEPACHVLPTLAH